MTEVVRARVGDLRVDLAVASVTGWAHRSTGRPNQDAAAVLPSARAERSVVERVAVAVADGHGSPRSFRSATGARLAVERAVRLLSAAPLPDPSGRGTALTAGPEMQDVLRDLTEGWHRDVLADLHDRPFTPTELEHLVAAGGVTARSAVERNPLLAYGTTLVTVVASPERVDYLQLGDGDVLAVGRDGDVARPLSDDPALVANETTSLCQPEAWREFRLASHRRDELPRLVLLSTDGYANSFEDDAAFLRVGSDLLRLVEEQGLAAVASDLRGWLEETSRLGAGDDVTAAVVTLAVPDVGPGAEDVGEAAGERPAGPVTPVGPAPAPEWHAPPAVRHGRTTDPGTWPAPLPASPWLGKREPPVACRAVPALGVTRPLPPPGAERGAAPERPAAPLLAGAVGALALLAVVVLLVVLRAPASAPEPPSPVVTEPPGAGSAPTGAADPPLE